MIYPDYKNIIQRTLMIVFLAVMLIGSLAIMRITADDPTEILKIIPAKLSQADDNTSAEVLTVDEPEYTPDILMVNESGDIDTDIADTADTSLLIAAETQTETAPEDKPEIPETQAVHEVAPQVAPQVIPVTEPAVVEINAPVREPYYGNPDDPDTIVLSFVGDCMLATMLGSEAYGTFNALANSENPEYFFSGVADIFKNDDWTVANCENVFTDKDLKATYKNYSPAYWYRSKTENANIFTVGGVEVVSIANNHAKDYGDEGREDTIAALEKYGVEWGDNDKPLILEKSGVRVALLCTTLYYSGYESTIINWIKQVKDSVDYIIIYYHGGTERQHTPDSWRVSASKKMIDAGADLIIGNHPHVLQPVQEYNGGYIIHSLGNFLFGGSSRPENRTAILQVKLNLSDGKIESDEYNLIPCYVYTDPWKPAVIENQTEIDQVLSFLNGKASTPFG